MEAWAWGPFAETKAVPPFPIDASELLAGTPCDQLPAMNQSPNDPVQSVAPSVSGERTNSSANTAGHLGALAVVFISGCPRTVPKESSPIARNPRPGVDAPADCRNADSV